MAKHGKAVTLPAGSYSIIATIDMDGVWGETLAATCRLLAGNDTDTQRVFQDGGGHEQIVMSLAITTNQPTLALVQCINESDHAPTWHKLRITATKAAAAHISYLG